jgi:hypothetical protein
VDACKVCGKDVTIGWNCGDSLVCSDCKSRIFIDTEAEEGRKLMRVARSTAYILGHWTSATMERAVFGHAIETDALTGVTTILQDFAIHNEGKWEGSWEDYICKQFERIFNNKYKKLDEP